MLSAIVHPHGDGNELCNGFVASEDVRDYFSKMFGGGGGGCGARVCEFAGGFGIALVGSWVVGVPGDEGVAAIVVVVVGVAVEAVADRRHAGHFNLAWTCNSSKTDIRYKTQVRAM